jgi:chromosome condensin MukBEF MukE localization factor
MLGGSIKDSPLYDDYLKLVDESGGMYFIFDENVGKDINMTKEQEKN